MEINALVGRQTNGTEDIKKKITHSLNYCTTHPESTTRYKRSDAQLYIYSEAYYMSELEAKIRAGGFFYLVPKLENPEKSPN